MRNKISRSFSLFLSLLMLLGLLASTTVSASAIPQAQQQRFLYINGKAMVLGGEMVKDGAANAIDKFGASVKYDLASNTLTLNNANLSRIYYSSQHRAWDHEKWTPKPDDTPFTLVLNGKNKVQAGFVPRYDNDPLPNLQDAMVVESNLVVKGSGSLVVNNVVTNVAHVRNAIVRGKLNIQGGKLEFYNYSNNALFVEGGIYVNTAKGASLTAAITGPVASPALSYGSSYGLRTSGKAVIASGENKNTLEASSRLKVYRSYSSSSGVMMNSSHDYVTIQPMVKSIKAKVAKKTLKAGASFELVPVSRVKGVPVGVCTFVSSNKNVATVDRETGEITAVAAGKAVVTIRQANGARAKCVITVI